MSNGSRMSAGQARCSNADSASSAAVDLGSVAPLPSSSVTKRGSTKNSSTVTATEPAVARSSG